MGKFLDLCAHELMDTTPKIMQSIRAEMRSGHGADLTIPQFRTLRFIQRNPDSCLSSLADHLGLTLPSVSKLVDGLVKQELISRQEAIIDRRKITLVLTRNGESIVNAARANAQANIAKILRCLSPDELKVIHQAMVFLHPLFLPQSRQEPVSD
jgi:DNA-binding MarR family transcriptional regulator